LTVVAPSIRTGSIIRNYFMRSVVSVRQFFLAYLTHWPQLTLPAGPSTYAPFRVASLSSAVRVPFLPPSFLPPLRNMNKSDKMGRNAFAGTLSIRRCRGRVARPEVLRYSEGRAEATATSSPCQLREHAAVHFQLHRPQSRIPARA
jgi:hypothetical protein